MPLFNRRGLNGIETSSARAQSSVVIERIMKHLKDHLLSIKRRLAIRSRFKSVAFSIVNKHKFGITPVQNVWFDLCWGGYFGGINTSQFSYLGAYRTQSTNYGQLCRLFKSDLIQISPTDVLVDVGCGKGRVLNFWLGMGLKNEMIGLELDPHVAEKTRKRLAAFSNVRIISGDAVTNLPVNGNLFYLYNPFDEAVMQRFKARLAESYNGSRAIKLVYYNCHHRSIFETDPNWTIEPLDTGDPYPAVSIQMIRDNVRSQLCMNCS